MSEHLTDMVENYALSLFKHGVCNTIDDGRIESARFFEKSDRGLVEPMKCPHHPNIEVRVTKTKDGFVEEHGFVELICTSHQLIFFGSRCRCINEGCDFSADIIN